MITCNTNDKRVFISLCLFGGILGCVMIFGIVTCKKKVVMKCTAPGGSEVAFLRLRQGAEHCPREGHLQHSVTCNKHQTEHKLKNEDTT